MLFPDLKDVYKGKIYMIVTIKSGVSIDTSHDLSAPERHILQKLLLWKDLAVSVEEFRCKKEQALVEGWNNSGPIRESRVLGSIIRDLEETVAQRLLAEKMGH
jgi:hypothetical protein